MKCQDCSGEIDLDIPIYLPASCGGGVAHPCQSCGRLYRKSGKKVVNDKNKKVSTRNGRIGYGGKEAEL